MPDAHPIGAQNCFFTPKSSACQVLSPNTPDRFGVDIGWIKRHNCQILSHVPLKKVATIQSCIQCLRYPKSSLDSPFHHWFFPFNMTISLKRNLGPLSQNHRSAPSVELGRSSRASAECGRVLALASHPDG